MTIYCPRGPGPGSPFSSPFNGEMTWGKNNTCSYCGSLHPDIFMARVEAGTIKLQATDKNYKVYVANDGGEPISGKFYYYHLSEEQYIKFRELYNAGKVRISG